MKLYLQTAFTGLLLLTTAMHFSCNSEQEQPQSGLVIVAVVKKIGKHPGVSSGGIMIYQLVKYGVVEVCSGTYNRNEILVDHLLVSGDEVKSLRVGEKVYLTLSVSKTIDMRFNEEGLRSASDNVDTFYIGHTPDTVKPATCNE